MEPWVAAWLSGLDQDAVAAELARPGLNMIAQFRYPSGLRGSAEAMVDGLREIGVGVSLRDVRTDREDEPGHERFVGFETHVSPSYTFSPSRFRELFERADLSERSPRSYRIAYWYWEFERFPTLGAARPHLSMKFGRHGVRRQRPARKAHDPGAHPIPWRTPCPLRVRGRPISTCRRRDALPVHLSHDERSGAKIRLGSFAPSNEPSAPTSRHVSCSRLRSATAIPTRSTSCAKLLKASGSPSSMKVYSFDDVLALMEACDVYVSLHRSEGLGLAMAEAMLMGKPVVATGYSGNTEFMNEEE